MRASVWYMITTLSHLVAVAWHIAMPRTLTSWCFETVLISSSENWTSRVGILSQVVICLTCSYPSINLLTLAPVWRRSRLSEALHVTEEQLVEWSLLLGNDYTFSSDQNASHRQFIDQISHLDQLEVIHEIWDVVHRSIDEFIWLSIVSEIRLAVIMCQPLPSSIWLVLCVHIRLSCSLLLNLVYSKRSSSQEHCTTFMIYHLIQWTRWTPVSWWIY